MKFLKRIKQNRCKFCKHAFITNTLFCCQKNIYLEPLKLFCLDYRKAKYRIRRVNQWKK